jgi:signal peptidase I
MQPTLRPGDRLLVSGWLPVRVGDVVVYRESAGGSASGVKRVAAILGADGLDVRGDNVNVSHDSRHFGPLPRASVIGRAFYRYLPADRRGSL